MWNLKKKIKLIEARIEGWSPGVEGRGRGKWRGGDGEMLAKG
jgi:hypothetical protein